MDVLPDLAQNQVIIYTEWMGRNPQIMEDQVTYPLVSNLHGGPNIKGIRAASMFGMSFVFVLFEDDVDSYWARSQVLKRLHYVQKFLPPTLTPSLGPDGTGVSHMFWFTLHGAAAPRHDGRHENVSLPAGGYRGCVTWSNAAPAPAC